MKLFSSLFILFLFLLVAITNLQASSPRMALVEEYTSSYCGACVGNNPAFAEALKRHLDVCVPFIIHTGNSPGDPLYKHNPSLSGRILTYITGGSYGTPSVYVNGTKVDITGAEGELYRYKTMTSPLTMYVFEERSGSTVTVNVVVQSDEKITGTKKLFIGVVEEHIQMTVPGSSENDFWWTGRKLIPGSYPQEGINFTIEKGETKTFSKTYELNSEWDATKIYSIAFVQDYGTTREVLQAAKTKDLSNEKPDIKINLTSIAFDKVADTKTLPVEIQNTGLVPLTLSSIKIDGDAEGVYEIVDGSVSSLKAFEKTTLNIRFTPKENKYYYASLKISSNAKSAAQKTIPISGLGYGIQPKAILLVDAQSIDFGKTAANVVQSFNMRNTGTAPLNITGIVIENDNDGVFEVMSNTTLTIDVNAQVQVSLKFTPKDNVTYSGDLKITSNANNTPEVILTMNGEGEGVPTQAIIATNKQSVDFGSSAEDKLIELDIRNDGVKPLSITEVKFENDFGGVFELVNSTVPVIKKGSKHTLQIIFKPKDNKLYETNLLIKSNADNNATLSIPIKGQGDGVQSVNDVAGKEGLFMMKLSPNPFTENTILSYTVSQNTEISVELSLYDANGNHVLNIFNGILGTGDYKSELNNIGLSSGKYYVIANVNGQSFSLPLFLVK